MTEMRPEETLDILTVDRIAEVLQIRDADRPDVRRAEVLADLHVIRNMLAHYPDDGAGHSAAAQEMTVRAAVLLQQLADLEKTSLGTPGAQRMRTRARADRVAHVLDLHESGPAAAPGLREFGELESAIMDVMWAADRPYLVREVRERLSYNRPLAYTTVMTVMNILYGKGVLLREKHGRLWRYSPTESREEHDARRMTEVLRSGGNQAVTMLRFVERASDEEKEALRTAVRAEVLADLHKEGI
jgi:predicted transcriptional regulator